MFRSLESTFVLVSPSKLPFSMSGRGGPLGVPDGSVDDIGDRMVETNVFSKCVGH